MAFPFVVCFGMFGLVMLTVSAQLRCKVRGDFGDEHEIARSLTPIVDCVLFGDTAFVAAVAQQTTMAIISSCWLSAISS